MSAAREGRHFLAVAGRLHVARSVRAPAAHPHAGNRGSSGQSFEKPVQTTALDPFLTFLDASICAGLAAGTLLRNWTDADALRVR
jgi:hypothetical protein